MNLMCRYSPFGECDADGISSTSSGKGFPLCLEECQIRNKLWVELVPKHPDIDAIADHFFIYKGKNKTKTFTQKQAVNLSLVITYEKYEAIMQHRSDIEEVSLT